MKVMLGDVIVQEADGLDPVTTAAHELRNELRSGLAGADNRDALDDALSRLLLRPETFAQGTDRDPEAHEEHQRQIEIYQRDAAGHVERLRRVTATEERRKHESDGGRDGQREPHAKRIR